MKPIEVVADTKNIGMYRLRWKDGTLSEDFYNQTRANDILKNYDQYRENMRKRTLPSPFE